MSDDGRVIVSVIVPVFNEEENIGPLHREIDEVSRKLEDADLEMVFVDDGSADRSFSMLEELASRDERVKVVKLSRNFGSHAAILAGLTRASGDVVVNLSADLQDPPELIGRLLARWREGHDIVWAVREARGGEDGWMKVLLANLFYFLSRKFVMKETPATGTDIVLMDRRVVRELISLPERNFFLFHMIRWMGFRQAEVTYWRRSRHAGRSKWGLDKRVKAAIDVFAGYSYAPIRLITYTGLIFFGTGVLYGLGLVVKYIFGASQGAGPVMPVLLSVSGVQLVVLGILGEYVWRTLDQVRGRPRFVIEREIGIEKTPRTDGVGRPSEVAAQTRPDISDES